MHRAPRSVGTRWNVMVCVALAALFVTIAVTGPTAQARIASLLAEPTSVAVVDIDSVLSQLDERARLEGQLEALASRLENEVNALKDAADNMTGDIDLFTPGTEQYKDKRRQILEANARWQVQGELANRIMLEERSTLQRSLFLKIMDGVRSYAESEGWDIVLIDDSREEVPRGLTREQFSAFISTRSVAYHAESVDISDAVATVLNNAFRNNMNP